MLDGIRLSKDQLAVVALGITAEGFKFVLDFELGTSAKKRGRSSLNQFNELRPEWHCR